MKHPVIFWDVDTQHDFMDPDGKLYVKGAELIKPKLEQLTQYAHARGIQIVASSDSGRGPIRAKSGANHVISWRPRIAVAEAIGATVFGDESGGKGIRTPDLLIANETLYQLSYTPETFERSPLNVQNLVCISTGGPPVLPPC